MPPLLQADGVHESSERVGHLSNQGIRAGVDGPDLAKVPVPAMPGMSPGPCSQAL